MVHYDKFTKKKSSEFIISSYLRRRKVEVAFHYLKGFVEIRPFYHHKGYIKRDFYKGREGMSTELINKELKVYLEEVNNRVCKSHGEVIEERFKKEKDKLLPLPGIRFPIDRIYARRVDKTGLIWYKVCF